MLHIAVLLSTLVAIRALPSGPPSIACDTFTPTSAHGNTEQVDPTPYLIMFPGFSTVNGIPNYTPGETHTLAITGGPTNATFRGFLIQAVTVADGSVVGTFTDLPDVIPNSDGLVQAQINKNCMPVGGTATHLQPGATAGRRDLPYVMLNWKAPAAGTGDIQFRYSNVQVLTIWWADDVSATVQEEGAFNGTDDITGGTDIITDGSGANVTDDETGSTTEGIGGSQANVTHDETVGTDNITEGIDGSGANVTDDEVGITGFVGLVMSMMFLTVLLI